jgi:hypothetical protein
VFVIHARGRNSSPWLRVADPRASDGQIESVGIPFGMRT